MSNDCPCKKTDRYVSFIGLDCDAKAGRVMARIEEISAKPDAHNKFWDYFFKKRAGEIGPKSDDLFLIHSNLNQIRELFEEWGSDDDVAMLDQIEEECC
jgi:hypothetical protein